MNEQTINAIQKALAPVAEKIGQGAQYGWDVVVRQQYISGMSEFIWSALVFVAVIGVTSVTVHFFKRVSRGEDEETGLMIFLMLSSLLLMILFGCVLQVAIQHVMNPAYYALNFFIHLGTPTP